MDRFKKILMALTFLIVSQLSFAQGSAVLGDEVNEWDIYKDKYGKYLGLKEVRMKMIKLRTVGPDVELIKVTSPEKAPHLALIEYKAGSAGTSKIVHVYRAVIYDLKKQRFVGQAPLRRESADGKKLEAKWSYENGLLTIKDPREGKLEFKL